MIRINHTLSSGMKRVVMQVAPSGTLTGTLYWIHGDHLGSASLTTNISGQVVSKMRYYPFGEVRWQNGSTPTDRTFTGHQSEASGLGSLVNMKAREYSPILGRFLSADTIVPNPGSSQSLNRYSYVENSPLAYSDPSGHCRYDSSGNFAYAENCTAAEYAKLTWDDRLKWVQMFQRNHAPSIFQNIEGILEFFKETPYFSSQDGWASVADAGVLHAIQEGFRKYEKRGDYANTAGKAGELWFSFFSQLGGDTSKIDDPSVWSAWGLAEQEGVNYGIGIAENMGLDARASLNEKTLIESFVSFGNAYRDVIAGKGLIGSTLNSIAQINLPVPMPGIGTMERDAPHYWGLLDPRYSKDFVWSFSKYVIVSEADARFHWYFDLGLSSPGK